MGPRMWTPICRELGRVQPGTSSAWPGSLSALKGSWVTLSLARLFPSYTSAFPYNGEMSPEESCPHPLRCNLEARRVLPSASLSRALGICHTRTHAHSHTIPGGENHSKSTSGKRTPAGRGKHDFLFTTRKITFNATVSRHAR